MLNYSRVRSVVKPNRGTKLSAGIDFFVPQIIENEGTDKEERLDKFEPKFMTDLRDKNPKLEARAKITLDGIILDPQESVLIPSGIHVNLEQVN